MPSPGSRDIPCACDFSCCQRRKRLAWLLVLATVGMLVSANRLVAAEPLQDSAAGQPPVDVQQKPLEWIPPGSVVGKQAPAGFSHVIFISQTRVAAGDVAEVSDYAKRMAQLFSVAVVADVKANRVGEKTSYYLDKVALGIGMQIHGKNVIVDSEKQAELGANLGFIQRGLLSQCEKDFVAGNRQVARTPTMFVFDSDIMLLLDGEHRPAEHRYAILVSSETGQLGTLAWLMKRGPNRTYVPFDRPIQYLPAGLEEDRILNVKANKFFAGIPASDAFAQVKAAEGTPVPWTDGLRRLAALREYTPQTARDLEAELWKLWK